ncbi:MAG: ATP-dependent DNA ligase [Patescibacteria group bacterium]|nr:ATP-dependent DNA ligase [Patescibacteria group bacterium]
MKFRELSKFFGSIESTSSRLDMADLLAKVFSQCSSEESAVVSYLVIGRVAPGFIPIEFNVSEKTILNVFANIKDIKRENIADKYAHLGDIGLVAMDVVGKRRSRGLEIMDVYERLWSIAMVYGTGSVNVRNTEIRLLLKELCSIEAKFVVRILVQKLRLGLAAKTVLDALSVSSNGDKTARVQLESSYGVCSDLGHVASVFLDSGLKGLKKIAIVPGVPVSPMLVEREKTTAAIIKRIPAAIIQPKFDGLRCQIHIGVEDCVFDNRIWSTFWALAQKSGQEGLFSQMSESSSKSSRVKLFSRNLEDLTEMFPEVVKAVEELKISSGIFDSEVIGWNEATGEFFPFQETMTRKRKYRVKDAAQKVPVKAFIFDAIYLDGKSLVNQPVSERVKVVNNIFVRKKVLVSSKKWLVRSEKKLQKIFEKNISQGLEGIIAKCPNSKYKPGCRGFDWIKLKRASHGQLADTVDLVVLGYYFGRGRQADFGIGAFLGGVYDAKNDRFVTLAKVGTGVTDEEWRSIKQDLDNIKVNSAPKQVKVDKSLEPDQWVNPEIVVTVEADEITKSPNHTAGYALRFPRLQVWGRDKLPDDCTRLKEIVAMSNS